MITDDPLSWLYSRTGGGIRWGLERTAALLHGVGDPQHAFRTLHVGGTNGKGSVAALSASALRASGRAGPVGLYTSPHLVRFSERIQVEGSPVGAELLTHAVDRLRPAIERSGASFFEAATAIAFLCFAETGVETAVVEVGLGGRLDATNVIRPLASAVTGVSLDHQEHLGGSLAGIASEKAGIWKPGVPAITGESDPVLLAVLRERAREVGAPFRALDEVATAEVEGLSLAGTRIRLRSERWGDRALTVPLVGVHQARNAALAMELLGLLPEGIRPAREEIERGFRDVQWPGRFQVERIGGATWILDVAHNPAGVEALASTLDALELPAPRVLVAGILSDKDWSEMLPPLLARVDGAILTLPPTAPASRRWDPDAAARSLQPRSIPVRPMPDFEAALQRASTLAPHGTVIVTGSVHTVGDALVSLGLAG